MRKLVIFAVFLLALLFGVYAVLAKRAHRRTALVINAVALEGLVIDWTKAGKPTDQEALTGLVSDRGAYHPFLYTNSVAVDDKNYHCVFAIRSARFAEEGMLAITADQEILWISERGNRLIKLTR